MTQILKERRTKIRYNCGNISVLNLFPANESLRKMTKKLKTEKELKNLFFMNIVLFDQNTFITKIVTLLETCK